MPVNHDLEILPPKPERGEIARRDRIGLRAMCQESVHHFTILRRMEIAADYKAEKGHDIPEALLDRLQPLIEEYDPVVELAIMGADYRNDPVLRRQANADAAQYLRPKLSAVATLEDPERLAAQAERNKLASRLVTLVQAFEIAKREQSAPAEAPGGGA